jgi:hypothetical protein
MSAIAEKHSGGQSAAAQSAGKRQKTEQVPSGIGLAIFTSLLALVQGVERVLKVFIVDGDRTERSPAFWAGWKDQFHDDVPHNLYSVQVSAKGEYVPLTVPAAAHMTGESHTFTAEEDGRAILIHMVSKKWLPKCCFSTEMADEIIRQIDAAEQQAAAGLDKRAARKAKKKAAISIAKAVVTTVADIGPLMDMLVRFSVWQQRGSVQENGPVGSPFWWTELVMGGIKRGATDTQTAIDEGNEEACVDRNYAAGHLEKTGLMEFTRRDGSKGYTSTFSLVIGEEKQSTDWVAEQERRDTMSNWRCPHSYFAFVPGIVESEMEKVKELRETRNGRWVTIGKAMEQLDDKNKILLQHVLANRKTV